MISAVGLLKQLIMGIASGGIRDQNDIDIIRKINIVYSGVGLTGALFFFFFYTGGIDHSGHRMRIEKILMGCLILCLGWYSPCWSETRILAARVSSAPVVDGMGGDGVWGQAQEFVIHDRIAGLDVRLKAVYTDHQIFFLVRFPDPDESRIHKPWVWNPEKKLYEIGPQREDCFVFKWALTDETKELSVFSDQPHMADIWFWKAERTDPAGYADDKIDSLVSEKKPKSREMVSRSGTPMFLLRSGDQGEPAYKTRLRLNYQGETVSQFEPQPPSGSRADIQAKGVWSQNSWTVEFARSLDTGHRDDVQFDRANRFLFGISRHEIAGREPDLSATQPLYGTGDVTETLVLEFGL